MKKIFLFLFILIFAITSNNAIAKISEEAVATDEDVTDEDALQTIQTLIEDISAQEELNQKPQEIIEETSISIPKESSKQNQANNSDQFFTKEEAVVTNEDALQTIQTLIEDISAQEELDQKPQEIIEETSISIPKDSSKQNQTSTSNQFFTKKEVEDLIQDAIHKASKQHKLAASTPVIKIISDSSSLLAEKLSRYKVTGVASTLDFNVALFADTQNPDFNVKYKNKEGDIKTRHYKSNINSIGTKLEAALKLDLIFFVNTDLDFYNSNKTIELGKGFDIIFGLDFTYISLKNRPGGIIILGIPFISLRTLEFAAGILLRNILIFGHSLSLVSLAPLAHALIGTSIITGGYLAPINA